MLEEYSALDLSGEEGFFCGKILGDLGAEVIKVEPPGGDPSRSLPPFYEDKPDAERSLTWFAYNQGKKSITLDYHNSNGREILLKLIGKANWLIESFGSGGLEKQGLSYDILSGINPRLILTRISPFGQTGPYSKYKGSDIVALAMSAVMYTFGEPDRPPVRVSTPHSQAYLMAGSTAALASLMALYHEEATGRGQVVDVSVRESAFFCTSNAAPWWELYGVTVKRAGARREGRGFGSGKGGAYRQIWPCKDGYVAFTVFGGIIGAKLNAALIAWMDQDGMADETLRNIDWANFDIDRSPVEQRKNIDGAIERFLLAHTKAELLDGALKHRIMLYPVNDIEEIWNSEQLRRRDFWVHVKHPELKTSLAYPGPFVRSSLGMCRTGARAPLIGEHNEEVYSKIGLTKREMAVLRREGVI